MRSDLSKSGLKTAEKPIFSTVIWRYAFKNFFFLKICFKYTYANPLSVTKDSEKFILNQKTYPAPPWWSIRAVPKKMKQEGMTSDFCYFITSYLPVSSQKISGCLAPPWFWQRGGATPLNPPWNRLCFSGIPP